MQDLRLVGVHEDGEHLLLSGGSGASYRLAIDEALRAAARPAPRVQAGADSGAAMTPREIQARIRAGATVEEVAAESGEDLQRIMRFEGPVRAERDYMAAMARQVELSSALPAADGSRSSFDDEPATLGDMVSHRLRDFGIDEASLVWDAWRLQDGTWEVVAAFTLPKDGTPSVGEEPPARWIYSPLRKTIRNANRWAQQLSELEPVDGALPARRLAAVADRVFDFEADSADEADGGQDDAGEQETSASDNLLEVLRSRRGHRLGIDDEPDDALALMLNRGHIPPAHPRRESTEAHPSTGKLPVMGVLPPEDSGAGLRNPLFPPLGLASVRGTGPSPLELHAGISTITREITLSGEPRTAPVQDAVRDTAPDSGPEPVSGDTAAQSTQSGEQSGQPAAEPAAEPEAAEPVPYSGEPAGDGTLRDEAPAKRTVKPKRSSIPSWDEIVFGTKGD
ncbi:septation protein SepH [Arthrobacter mobilis]|uniref:DUF3071 domain-containing protein n=1 Tax=Arthrobacter mobilis TaxID=2724944 RepID=A0A7X6HDA1_9MICC|nr:septation protein SepH [Arthrobacter mobilis]NKX54886.1 DUF3071 domain-containing protein [Arthrobacter mobilis]